MDAARIGLVEQVVEAEVLMEKSLGLAKMIAGNPPIAVRLAKRAITMSHEMSLRAGLNYELSSCNYCVSSEDMHEATSSFLEKRIPHFKEK